MINNGKNYVAFNLVQNTEQDCLASEAGGLRVRPCAACGNAVRDSPCIFACHVVLGRREGQ